ncbi:hypothetical protein BDA99DRAFT_533968 [Phascolomyces articulosus]|uniref:Uncharacterized protein n=1 Tax=Phascolomyces articulosus TaxID=60185 RepID=A0AAD5PIH4_9FUNG|nr:hypothetical protein BDA99DRAFT_533968 [Phascolomyces articulosus]
MWILHDSRITGMSCPVRRWTSGERTLKDVLYCVNIQLWICYTGLTCSDPLGSETSGTDKKRLIKNTYYYITTIVITTFMKLEIIILHGLAICQNFTLRSYRNNMSWVKFC